MKWLQNALSVFRFIAAFPILYSTIAGAWLTALILIICGYLSDLFDGFLARRYNIETPTGKIIDITADIILDESIICGLVLTHQISRGSCRMFSLCYIQAIDACHRGRWLELEVWNFNIKRRTSMVTRQKSVEWLVACIPSMILMFICAMIYGMVRPAVFLLYKIWYIIIILGPPDCSSNIVHEPLSE